MDKNLPTIRVLDFRTKYTFNPSTKRNDRPVDFVCYAPVHAIMNTRIWTRVNDLRPPETDFRDDDEGKKMAFMRHRWSVIGSAYEAWKKGHELPVSGTALGAWPAINQDQAQVFQRVGLRTVEDVASMPDAMHSKVHLPNVRELQAQAKAFLEATDQNKTADQLAKQDRQIADLQEQLSAAMELLSQKPEPSSAVVVEASPKRGPGRPRKAPVEVKEIEAA